MKKIKTGFYGLTYYKLIRRLRFKIPFFGYFAIDFRKSTYTRIGRKTVKAMSYGKIGSISGFRVFKSK